jgi:hypothetical protein
MDTAIWYRPTLLGDGKWDIEPRDARFDLVIGGVNDYLGREEVMTGLHLERRESWCWDTDGKVLDLHPNT